MTKQVLRHSDEYTGQLENDRRDLDDSYAWLNHDDKLNSGG